MAAGRANPNFMNGVPELLVLRLLAGREMYGYELARAVRGATGQTISLGEGVIYPALHDLERSGCLVSRQKLVDGRTRVYYRVTARGRKRLKQVTKDWSRIADAVQTVLGGRGNAKPAI